ncbi:helix-turn-helix domain-containing protein [Planococcus shenhongbingii]|uniref:IclR family transcriptional regulator n=1 Tax=Planococcus shenhongbingii TaxID=3058398 RepID=UPI002604EC03|nr:helix-turn-helix domain-containing protein [Planococcus sp. N016]WKA59126.1 helix-turn-helix domain-containing protein [Planococcus sp. N016]
MEERKPAIIQSLQNGLDVLEMIAKERRPMKFTEIQQLTNMTKSNIHKYLTTLSLAGFLHRDSATHTYTLGNRLIEIGNMAQGDTSFIEIADSYMKAFAEETGLTALIALPSIDGPLVKEIWSVTYGIDIGAQHGTTLPLLSSTGYIFYAFQEGLQLNKWINQSSQTLSVHEQLAIMKEMEQVKEHLFAAKTEPLIEHISSCSVPVFNHQQELVAAITAVGYKNLIPQNHHHPNAQKMLALSKKLSNYST